MALGRAGPAVIPGRTQARSSEDEGTQCEHAAPIKSHHALAVSRGVLLTREWHPEFREQGCCRVEVLFSARLLADPSVAFSEPEVTLSRERSQTELLGPLQRLEKICLAFIKESRVCRAKLGKQPQCVGFMAALVMFA
jgi:hypothetical protein